MKTMLLKRKLFVLFLFFLPLVSLCQEEPPQFEGDTTTPIDSWLLVLLIFGVAYGAYKYQVQKNLLIKPAMPGSFRIRITKQILSFRHFILGSKLTASGKNSLA